MTPRKFLESREGASDSDVDALIREFGMTEAKAEKVYRAFLNSRLRKKRT